MRISPIFLRLSALAAAGILLRAVAWSVQLGWADQLRRRPDLASVTRSTELDPLNAQGFRAKALYEELAGLEARGSWRAATQLDPRNPRILIPAGVYAEIKGDSTLAEEYLKTAERWNRLWLPRWTLANYYARRGDRTKVIDWIRSALARSYGETAAAFELARSQDLTDAEIAEQLLPRAAHAYAEFVAFLTRTPVDAAGAALLERVASRFVEMELDEPAIRRQPETVIAAVERLRGDGHGVAALRLWNQACKSALIGSVVAAPGSLIINGDFARPFLGRGFDWRMTIPAGVEGVHHPGTGTVKFIFSGNQEGTNELLAQPLVLPQGTAWQVSFDFRTRGITPRQAAFSWMLDAEALPVEGGFSSEDWSTGHFVIPAAGQDRLRRLTLVLAQPVGAVRPEGELWLRNIRAVPN